MADANDLQAHQFLGENKFQIGIFLVFLNMFGSRIMHGQALCQVLLLGFLEGENCLKKGIFFIFGLHCRKYLV